MGAQDHCSHELADEIMFAGVVPPNCARVENFDAVYGAANEPALGSATNNLDFGKFRHANDCARYDFELCAASMAFQAAAAATCSASFFDRPTPSP